MRLIEHSQKIPLFVDSDNAMGSYFGDVDDGFAIAALFKSGLPLIALSSVFGNTFEPFAYQNNKRLASLCGASIPLLRGAQTWWAKTSPSAQWLASVDKPFRVLALGPLTNIALALREKPSLSQRIDRLTWVATRWGRPKRVSRFTDFNYWKDPKALDAVLRSSIPLTFVPLDVAKRFQVTRSQLNDLPTPLGDYLRKHSGRWLWRAHILKASRSFPVWDLIGVLSAINPSLFQFEQTTVDGEWGGTVRYGQGHRRVTVITDYDPDACWKYFCHLISANQTIIDT